MIQSHSHKEEGSQSFVIGLKMIMLYIKLHFIF